MKTLTRSVLGTAILVLYISFSCVPGNVLAQSDVSLPFTTDFESGEGYTSGSITSDASWHLGTDLTAEILSPGAGSSQALGFTGGDWLWLTTNDPGADISWVDFYLRPPFVGVGQLPEEIESPQSGVTGFVQLNNEGEVYAVDGDGLGGGAWTPSGFLTPLDGESALDWIRLTYRLDYLSKTWDLFIDGELILVDLGFLDDSVSELEEFSVFAGENHSVELDYFYAGHSNPLFADTSGDGLPDDWLVGHGLDPTLYQRYNDPDGDGLSNIEEYQGESHPAEGSNAPDALVNLALLPEATLSGMVDGEGRGTPAHILYDPVAEAYSMSSGYAEYGVSHSLNMGTVSEANGFYWMAEWPSAKNIKYITVCGSYPDQPQPYTMWKVQTRLGGVWMDLAAGQGGWINGGTFEWGGPGQTAVLADAVRVVLYSDGSHNVVSIHLRGRGAYASGHDDSASTPKATLIQFLPDSAPNPGISGDNEADAITNLALLSGATLSGSVSSGGKGAPDHILYDPATGDYVVQSNWAEYGVSHNQNLGTVDEVNGFYWMTEWDSPKNINYITFGGAYPNQPQPYTMWTVELRLDGVWTELDAGQGGWIDSGIYEWGGYGQAPLVADAVRVVLYSDGSHDLVSIHLRGRGAAALSQDDSATTPKATLIQYLPEAALPGDNPPDAEQNLALLDSAMLSGTIDGNGRGEPDHILYDPMINNYAVVSGFAEYGVSQGVNLGTVDEANGFYWMAEWPSTKNINYITFGGVYPNQAQPHTMWKVQTRLDGVWTDLDSGKGGWIDAGIFEWGGYGEPPIAADAVRVVLYSDGTHGVTSIHLRGRGGILEAVNDLSTTPKATLIQYLPDAPLPPCAVSAPGAPGTAPLNAILGREDLLPPVAIPFTLPADGYVTLVIEDSEGNRVRNLLSEVPFCAGANVVYWDGADESGGMIYDVDGIWRTQGALVEPGQYRLRGLFHQGIDLRYEFSVYNAGSSPWKTGDGTGRWLADHTPPSDVVYLPGTQPSVAITSFVAEGGDGLLWADLDGNKTAGVRWVGGSWTGASYLAVDSGSGAVAGVDFYAAASWPTDGNNAELRFTTLSGENASELLVYTFDRSGLEPVETHGLNLDADKRYVGGLAAHDGLLVASLDRHNELIFIDAHVGQVLATADAGDIRGVAFDSTGRLLALVGNSLHRYNLPGTISGNFVLPSPEVLVSNLDDPQQITLDAADNFFISEWGSSHSVKVFTPQGVYLRTVGTPGVPSAGAYDETRMNYPNGMAVTPDGHLWVAEHDRLPKRTSVWTTGGSFVRAHYGPPHYGGGGAIDPQDKTRFYYVDEKAYGGMEFELDWANGTSRVKRIYHRPDPEDPLRFPSRGPQTAFYHNGRQYMNDQFNRKPVSAPEITGLWLMENGLIRPVAAMGDVTAWPLLLEPSFASRLPSGVDMSQYEPGRSPVFFAWSDTNEDGEVQAAEVTTKLLPPLSGSGRHLPDRRIGEVSLSSDLTLTTTFGNQLEPDGFTAGGVPLYDAADLSGYGHEAEVVWSSGARVSFAGSHDRMVLTGGPLRGFENGVLKWTYENPWASLHDGHNAPAQQYPGQMIATTRPISLPVSVPHSDVGEIWAYNGNAGHAYLMSMDGLYISQLFRNSQKANHPHWDSLPAQRGIQLDNVGKLAEDFWPTFNATADGKFYLVAGKEHSSIVRVDGLESIERIDPISFELTSELRVEASDYAILRDEMRQEAQGDAVLDVAVPTNTPVVDGSLGEWDNADWVRIDGATEGAVIVSGSRLYAAYRTVEGGILDNEVESLPMIFKTGGGLDLMVGSDPNADPERSEPVVGDVRLLVTRDGGQTVAALYQPVVDGPTDPVSFTSPWRTVTFDRVDDVSSQVQLASGTRQGEMEVDGELQQGQIAEYEVSIPLTDLGLQPATGQSIIGDIGVLRGSDGVTRQRVYWHNKATGLVDDVPGEAQLTPQLWGQWDFE